MKANDSQKSNLDLVNNLIENYSRKAEELSRFMVESSSAFSRITQQISDFQKNLSYILPDFKRITEYIENMKKFREFEKKALIESGWFICPSLNPVPYHYIRKAVVRYNQGDKSSISVLMKRIYDDEDCKYLKKTTNSWKGHRFFTKQRMKIIDDALDAHKKGIYTLSIPALLPIIEGISGDFCEEQKIKVAKSKSLIKAKNSIQEIGLKDKLYLAEVVLEFIENQLYIESTKLKGSKNKKYLNRHAILHGSYTGYADCTRSLRCFLLLDVLSLL